VIQVPINCGNDGHNVSDSSDELLACLVTLITIRQKKGSFVTNNNELNLVRHKYAATLVGTALLLAYPFTTSLFSLPINQHVFSVASLLILHK
jgi:hypothetical protein